MLAAYWLSRTRTDPAVASPVSPEDVVTGTGYVNSAVCSGCHAKIAETYRRTGMGRSFYRPKPENTVEDYTRSNEYYHQPSDRYYRMYQRGGRYFQRRHQIGPNGRETNVAEKEVHFVVGSGNHTRTYLHLAPDGRLLELPLAWYSDKGGFWAMNPGYDRPDHHGFRRRVTYECMFCHNAYPSIPAGGDRSGTDPLFPAKLPEGIDCQRCHGPGRGHVQAASSGEGSEKVRASILNPKRLDRVRQLDVCMQCHLETTSFPLPHSLRRIDRGIFSYKPGEPLEKYMMHFDHPPGSGYDDKFEIAHQAYRLRKSACFQKSGSMTCTTCHNPHDVPRGAAAVAHYSQVCRTCHAGIETLVKTGLHTSAEDCQTCHMPRRRTDDVVHVVMTDHFIQRRKPARDLTAPLSEIHLTRDTAYRGSVAAYFPQTHGDSAADELLLAIAQVKHNTNLQGGIPQLESAIGRHKPASAEYYFELAEAHWNNGEQAKAFRSWESALQRSPEALHILHSFGTALAKAGQTDRAIEILERAVAAAPANALSRTHLAMALLDRGRLEDAINSLRQAVERDPDLPEAHNALGTALLRAGDREAAERAFSASLRAQPDYAEAHKNLAELLMGRGALAAARYHLTKAVTHKPDYDAAYVALGDALAMQNDLRGAISHYRKAAEIAPDSVAANFSLGAALAAVQQFSDAKAHLARVIRSEPEHYEARLQLGTILLQERNRAAAEPHLRIAASSPDADIRQAAARALR